MRRARAPLALFSALLCVCVAKATAAEAEDGIAPMRVSVAISGGASLGAYVAGVSWGLGAITRTSDTIDSRLGGRFRPVRLESVSGSSSGGISSLLSGLTWCLDAQSEGGLPNRLDANIFRDVWLTPDINRLLPPDARSPTYLPDDGVFSRRDLAIAAERLREAWSRPNFRPGCRVRLGVTVTRVEPETLHIGDVRVDNQRLLIPFDLSVKDDGTVSFRFNPADYPAQARGQPDVITLPYRRGDAPYTLDDRLVIDAIFASSAFPVAFGRKRLSYCRSYAAGARSDITSEAERPVETGELFCPEGYKLAEAEFSDVGLFDNQPVGLARRLAENPLAVRDEWMPVTYFYLSAERTRYHKPAPPSTSLCDRPNPPTACAQMEFGIGSESALLFDALSTGRRYELFRELSSDHWTLNLPELGYKIAAQLRDTETRLDCGEELPFFNPEPDCAEALERASRLISVAYSRVDVPMTAPLAPERLREAGIAGQCRPFEATALKDAEEQCRIDVRALRDRVANAQLNILDRSGLKRARPDLVTRARRARVTTLNDRRLRVNLRGAPVTGSLFESFGAFLDRKFREYDYYVGVYDAAVAVTTNQCRLHYSLDEQATTYANCLEIYMKGFHELLGIEESPRARYVFAMAARDEFIRRTTERLLALEQDAERILAERDPQDPSPANVATVSKASYLLRTQTYRYPSFAWSPSVAPKEWLWRNIIPYELALDLFDGDILITWQPTWGLTNRDNLSLRGTLGLVGGILTSRGDDEDSRVAREDFVSLGLDYTRSSRSGTFSYGIGTTYYYLTSAPAFGPRDSWGADAHVGFLRNRIRLALGVRDFDDADDSWFFNVGLADLPGLIFWSTR